jgi:hypothetical protein
MPKEEIEQKSLVVESRAKEVIKALGGQAGDEFMFAFGLKVADLLAGAITRAKGNGRVRLQAQDL